MSDVAPESRSFPPDPDPACLPPMVRTALDVALWFQARAGGAERLTTRKLHCLLYLAQAYFAAAQQGRRLMPASFIAAAGGPLEPTIERVLGCGLARVPAPEIPPRIEEVLAALWQQYGAVPGPGLARLIAADGVWRLCRDTNPDGLIPLTRLQQAYGASMGAPVHEPELRPVVKSMPGSRTKPGSPGSEIEEALAAARAAATPSPAPEPPPAAPLTPEKPAGSQEDGPIRSRLPPVTRPSFTLDGRPITPWTPRRRLPG